MVVSIELVVVSLGYNSYALPERSPLFFCDLRVDLVVPSLNLLKVFHDYVRMRKGT